MTETPDESDQLPEEARTYTPATIASYRVAIVLTSASSFAVV